MTEQKPKTINTELIYYMFDEIKLELREMKKDYVTKAESAALKNEIGELRNEIEALKKSIIVTGKQIGRASCRERVYVLV